MQNAAQDAQLVGSSPRERGARGMITLPSGAVGLIPAGAGSTRCRQQREPQARAHPRGSGEHPGGDGRTKSREGSSPRERGAPIGSDTRYRPHGLIPAGAGSTISSVLTRRPARAHPRGSGEHRWHRNRPSSGVGSSPRERGAPTPRRPRTRPEGLIPAGAGSTRWSTSRGPVGRAHPRGSGEHECGRVAELSRWGSSPRERGARVGRGAR